MGGGGGGEGRGHSYLVAEQFFSFVFCCRLNFIILIIDVVTGCS